MWGLAIVFGFVVAGFVLIYDSVHQVTEGHVGVYWFGGALLDEVTNPGYHFKIPFFSQFEEVQTTLQTDKVVSVPCGTSGGIVIHFDSVEVVNRLKKEFVLDTVRNYTTKYDAPMIFNKVHHELNQFCSSHSLQEVYITLFDTLDDYLVQALQKGCTDWAPGIEVVAVRVTKPTIPAAIRANFEQIESEKTKLQLAEQSQKVAEKYAETKRKEETIRATMEAEVSAILSEQQVATKKALQTMEVIQNLIHTDREKALADAEYYRKEREAAANALLLTPAYLQLQTALAVANNSKIYYGDKLPLGLSLVPEKYN